MDLAKQSPGVRPAGARSHNLPVQLTSFIGRAAGMDRVGELLAQNRLVTLPGVGRAGKTRLALQVAAGMLGEFPAGVWLVDLDEVLISAMPDVSGRTGLGRRMTGQVLRPCQRAADVRRD